MNKTWALMGVVIVASVGWAAEEKAPTATYIGMKKCKMCHKAQFESWAKTPHANALKALAEAKPEAVEKMAAALGATLAGKPDQAPACLACHVTGHGAPGGYTVEKGKDDMSDSVGCESCHGAGSLHMKAAKAEKSKTITGKVGEQECLKCHTPAMSPGFKFEEYVKKGVHESFKKK